MSKWLNDGEVLVGQGSGEAVPVSPRPRSIPNGSPMPGRSRSPLASPGSKETGSSPQAEVMGKAKQLFVLCDKEGKGFITKRDMQVSRRWAGVQRCSDMVFNCLSACAQRLQAELPLSPEQLEEVFESLDRLSNGFLTPNEFNTGLGEHRVLAFIYLLGSFWSFLNVCVCGVWCMCVCVCTGELMGLEDTAELSQNEADEEGNGLDLSEDPAVVRVVNVLMELGGEKLLKE